MNLTENLCFLSLMGNLDCHSNQTVVISDCNLYKTLLGV
jgi:hypothetical protein